MRSSFNGVYAMKDKIMYLLDAYTSTGLIVGCRGDEIYNSDTGEILTPSDDIKAKAKALEAEYDAKQYQRDRQYPSIGDQLDLLFHDMTNGKDDKTGEWYKAVNKVKMDNPKPE